MSTGFAVLEIGLGTFGGAVVWSTPAPYPWAIIAIIGWIGIILHPKSD